MKIKNFAKGLAISLPIIVVGMVLETYWFGDLSPREARIGTLWLLIGQFVAYGYATFRKETP